MTKQELLTDFSKVMGAHLCAIGINFTDVDTWLKRASLIVALGYGIWKWRVDYVKNKKSKRDPYK